MSSLSHRERVIRALRGERPDRPPCGEFFVSDEFVRSFLGLETSAAVEFHHHREVIEQLDTDITSVSFSSGWGALQQPDENKAVEALMQWSEAGDRFSFALIDGPFSAAVKMRGFNMLVHYLHGAPHLARDLFHRGADETRVIAQAVRDAGAGGVLLGEDIAYGRSTYFSPQHLRDLYFEELTKTVRDLRALGLVVFFHSDGNLSLILHDLAACELDGLQGLEPEAGMQLSGVRSQVGSSLTLWGNLGYDFLSVPHPEKEIDDTARELARAGAGDHGGKLFLGSCAGLVQGMNPETVRRVYRSMTLPDLFL